MRQVFDIFFKAERTKPWLVLLCLIIASILEAIGIGSLLPVADAIIGGAENNNTFATAIRSIFVWLGQEPTLGNLLLLVGIAMTLKSIALFLAMSYASLAAARVVTNLRRRLIKAVFDARWNYYVSQNAGTLASAISGDAQRAGDAYVQSARVVTYAVQALGLCVIALMLNWKAALAGIGAGLIIVIISRRLVQMTKRHGEKLVQRIGSITTDALDLLKNIKPLKAMNRYEPMIDDMTTKLGRLKRSIIKLALSQNALLYGTDALLVVIVCIATYTAHEIVGMALPELSVLGLLFFQIVSYVTKLQRFLQNTYALMGSHQRIINLIQEAQGEQEAFGGVKPPLLDGDIRFENVSFSHGSKQILDDVTVEMPNGQITVLTGPSGGGKTTLIDLFTGLHRPLSGRITLGGTDLAEIDIKALRRKIGYVSQELVLFHDTVKGNVSLWDEKISDDAVREALRQAGALNFVEALSQGIDTDVGEQGGRLSGGQRQRIALARALIGDPEILILDEVTSALDPESEAEIIRNIAGLRGQYTIIAITHRPAWKDVADRIYQVNNGHIAQG